MYNLDLCCCASPALLSVIASDRTTMRKMLSEYADDPIFNMKAVEQQTDISAATLRAWERRYGLVEPKRTNSGYRLYSERDVALLRWVKTHIDNGLTISRVVALVENIRADGDSIQIDTEPESVSAYREAPMPPSSMIKPLFNALTSMDSQHADEIMEQAFAMYTMPVVYVEIIAPVLVEVGEAWHRGEIFISVEHYATTYMRSRLLSLLQAYPHRPSAPSIFVGCAPTERHEVGALIFAVMLRQNGYNIVYLGQDVPARDIIETALQERPAMVSLSASSPNAAILLAEIKPAFDKVGQPAPIFTYGGRAFDNDPHLRDVVPGIYLGSDPRLAVKKIKSLLDSPNDSDFDE